MKSTFKRILALVMVLCTVAAWMIPGVSVSAADNDLVVDFKTSANNAGVVANKYFNDQAVVGSLASAYETNGWKPYAVYSVYPARFYGNALALAVRANSNNVYQYLPLQFTAPADGDYTLTLGVHSNVNTPLTDFRAYVIPVPETAYDKAALNTAMNAKLSETALLQYNPTEITTGKVSGEEKVTLEGGKEYLLVFCTYGAKDGTVLLTGFTLNYQKPEVFVPAGPETIDFTTVYSDYNLNAVTDLINGYTLYATGAAINADYDAEDADFALVAGHRMGISHVRAYNGNLKLTGRNATATSRHAFALKVRAPGAGKYDVSLGYIARPGNEIADNVEVYMLPMPNVDFWGADGKMTNGYELNNLGTANPLYEGGPTVNAENLVLTSAVQDATMEANSENRVANGGTFTFEANKEYMVIIAITEGNASTATPAAELLNLNFTPFAVEATIEGKFSGTLADALTAAVSGDTIVLGKNVAVDELDLPDGVALDLNGKTLTVDAVAGKVADSADGEGLIVVGKDAAVISAVSGQVVLWDNNVYTPGYRVFSYEQSNYGITAGEDNATGVNEKIHFYDYVAAGLEDGTIENADIKLRGQLAAIRAAYENGTSNWCMEGSTQTYQFRETAGTNAFSSGTSGLYLTMGGSDVYALRFNSPGEGKIGVTIKVGTAPYNKTCATVNYYIVEASKFEEALGGDYATLAANWDADPFANATDAWKTALKGLTAGETPVATHTGDKKASEDDAANYDSTVQATFEFKADTEYLLVCQQAAGTYLYLKDLNFSRYEKQGMTQTFWSTLKFTNPLAYTLINTCESGLTVGFEMDWNGNKKTFQFDDATLATWAADQAAYADKTFGLYIRVSGFEALTETGTLTGKAYVATVNATTYADGVLTYDYTV